MYQNIFITRQTDTSPAMVHLWDDEKGFTSTPFSDFRYAYKKDDDGKYISMYGDKLKKVKRFGMDDVGLFESDVSREVRVLSDVYLHDDMPSKGHRVMFYDIETDSSHGFGEPSTALKAITSIGSYYVQKDEYMVFLLDTSNRVKSSKNGNETVLVFDKEDEMLLAWLEYYTDVSPTILSGWNSDGYDLPYLYNRLRVVFGENVAAKLSPIGIVEYNEYRSKYVVAGVSNLDYLPIYKKYRLIERPNYQLNTIGLIEVNLGKVEYTGTLSDLYESDIEKFIEYNIRDVKILVELDKKLQYIELVRFICHLGHVAYEDCTYPSKYIEGTILTYLHRKGIIAPNKPDGGREAFAARMESNTEGFTGAYVKTPFPNKYEWVYSLDLQSLYPSIIMSLNISPETKRGKIENWDVELHVKGALDRYVVSEHGKSTTYLTRSEMNAFLKDNDYSIAANGVFYANDRTGIIPEILDKWFAERVEFKNLMKQYAKSGDKELESFYDRRQHVQKILLNSIYGVLGLQIFRFYDIDNASAVTITGQNIIKTTAKYINTQYKKAGVSPQSESWADRYWEVIKEDCRTHKRDVPERPSTMDHCIYIDTDSVYFSSLPMYNLLPEPREDIKTFTISLARRMEAELNKFYSTMAIMMFNCTSHRFVIKGESIIERGLWLKKKRYVFKQVYDLETNKDKVVTSAEDLKVKGLDIVRSSFPAAFKKFMSEILLDILNDVPRSQIDEKVLTFKRYLVSIPYLQLARNTSVKDIQKYEKGSSNVLSEFPSKTPIHVKAAISYNRLLKLFGVETMHRPIKNGDKIRYVFLKKNPYKLDVVALKTYDDPEKLIEFVEEYIDYDRFFEAELSDKLENFYEALEWGHLPTKFNQAYYEFFK